jgi:hypothetical protein
MNSSAINADIKAVSDRYPALQWLLKSVQLEAPFQDCRGCPFSNIPDDALTREAPCGLLHRHAAIEQPDCTYSDWMRQAVQDLSPILDAIDEERELYPKVLALIQQQALDALFKGELVTLRLGEFEPIAKSKGFREFVKLKTVDVSTRAG